jgi:hypothetical protein
MNLESKFTILASVLAFLIYGAWAAYVNSEYGTAVYVKAGLGQGLYALLATWIMTALTQATFVKAGADGRALLLAFLAGFAVMLAIPLTIHFFLDTPDVLEAITPGLIWGSGYLLVVLNVTQKQQKNLQARLGVVTAE